MRMKLSAYAVRKWSFAAVAETMSIRQTNNLVLHYQQGLKAISTAEKQRSKNAIWRPLTKVCHNCDLIKFDNVFKEICLLDVVNTSDTSGPLVNSLLTKVGTSIYPGVSSPDLLCQFMDSIPRISKSK
jgi:hypothetical protein